MGSLQGLATAKVLRSATSCPSDSFLARVITPPSVLRGHMEHVIKEEKGGLHNPKTSDASLKNTLSKYKQEVICLIKSLPCSNCTIALQQP